MRNVSTRPPSFPEVPADQPLPVQDGERWQVVCGDAGHWRAGGYSPPQSRADELDELERHDCPELFLLLSGHLTLVLSVGGKVTEVALQPGKPVLVVNPHNGYCPDGPHTGQALVIERDAFQTEYRDVGDW
jgi:hypothetical protein